MGGLEDLNVRLPRPVLDTLADHDQRLALRLIVARRNRSPTVLAALGGGV
jgi:hypothetical protein